MSMVASQVVNYMDTAGYQIVVIFRLENHIKKELTKYQTTNKSKDRNTAGEVKKREDYLQDLKKIFDIVTPNLEDILQKCRILGNEDVFIRYNYKKGNTRKTEEDGHGD